MAVRDPEQALPRSALRYRPMVTNQVRPAPTTSRARRRSPDAHMTTASAAPDDLELEKHASGRRASASMLRRSAPLGSTRRRVHPLLLMGLGLVAMILLLIGLVQAVNWGTNELNTLKYGNPRSFQVDAVVGHGDNTQHPSHFLAVNLHGSVTIIEFPASDPGHAQMLASTTVLGPNADLAVVTLQFIDVNHNSKPDMLVTIDGRESVLINDGQTFRPPTPAEQQQILNALQQNNA